METSTGDHDGAPCYLNPEIIVKNSFRGTYFAPSSGYTDPMADPSDHPIARAIEASTAGDSQAASRLVPLFYDELRRLARSLLARNPRRQTIQATALVHEAYLRIVGKDHVAWHGRRQFFATAAQAMRDILVEEARRKASLKRGGDRERVPLDGEAIAIDSSEAHVLDIDAALTKLEKLDPRKVQIIQLRYFAGLSVAETADVLDVSVGTVEREWRYIRAWLSRELSAEG